jgi:hypothetical protein
MLKQKVILKSIYCISVFCSIFLIYSIVMNSYESKRMNEVEKTKYTDIITSMDTREIITEDYQLIKLNSFPSIELKENEQVVLLRVFDTTAKNKDAVFIVNYNQNPPSVYLVNGNGFFTTNYYASQNLDLILLILVLSMIENLILMKYRYCRDFNMTYVVTKILIVLCIYISTLPGYMINIPCDVLIMIAILSMVIIATLYWNKKVILY